jgi:hypothetical protein
MHKGVILLVKADDAQDATSQVNNFLEPFGDGDVWDWYVIGGRWSGTLNKSANTFYKKAEEHFKAAYPDNENPFLTSTMVEEQATALQEIWESLGETSTNPYKRNTYNNLGDEDDIVRLSDCISVVKEWTKDMDKEAEEQWNKMIEAKKEEDAHDMSPYYAKRYAEAKYDEFCFDSNVYDTVNHTNDPEEALKNPEEWWAVMVDMHN